MSPRLQARIEPLLRRNTLLGRLPDAVLDQLMERGQPRRYAKGEFVFQRGDPGDGLMVLVTGGVKLTMISARAREIVVLFVAPGGVFGDIAALDGKPRAVSAVALQDSEVFVIRSRDLMPALMASPPAMMEIIRSLCERARSHLTLIEDATLDMRTRFVRGLLRLAHQVGRRRRDGTHLDLAFSQEELGSHLGLARANVSRQLGRLKALGLIRVEGTRLVITDERGLAELAEPALGD